MAKDIKGLVIERVQDGGYTVRHLPEDYGRVAPFAFACTTLAEAVAYITAKFAPDTPAKPENGLDYLARSPRSEIGHSPGGARCRDCADGSGDGFCWRDSTRSCGFPPGHPLHRTETVRPEPRHADRSPR